METNEQAFGNEYDYEYVEEAYEYNDEADTIVEVKVSGDDGDTWTRRKISMAAGLDGSGLNAGELFVFNGEKFRVLAGDDGLRIEPLKSPVITKSKSRQNRSVFSR